MTDIVVSKTIIENVRDKTKELRREKTPDKVIKRRQGKSGKWWSYIDRITAMRWLDKNYPVWQWNFDFNSVKEIEGYYVGIGKLNVMDDSGIPRIISTVGSQEIQYLLDKNTGQKTQPLQRVQKEYIKGVDTDSLKRCVFTLGGFTDVYTSTEEKDLEYDNIVEENLSWFLSKVFPILQKRIETNPEYTMKDIAKAILAFQSGELKREYINKKIIKED